MPQDPSSPGAPAGAASVNAVPLSPVPLLRRTAEVFPTRTALVHGARRDSYSRFYERVCRLANGLRALEIGREGKVAVLCPNVPPMAEAHFAIPAAGGVIVAVNTRLNPREVGFILQHSESEVLLVDRGLLGTLRPVMDELGGIRTILVAEDESAGPDDGWRPPGALDYDAFLAAAPPEPPPEEPVDERQVIAIDYTSGTTGDPKGVMYTHRGAALGALSNMLQHGIDRHSVYLWTLPMFHCNGWCFTWTLPISGGTAVCLRTVEPARVRELVEAEQVTHFCGAPIVLQMLAHLAEEHPFRFGRTVRAATGGAPPSPTLLATMRKLNVEVTHLYGLTETYGPNTICEVQEAWQALPPVDYARMLARQGVANPLAGEVVVLDADNAPVPQDGETLGEICQRGNTVMKGYFKNPRATEAAFRGGWFHTGDLAVWHPDGYIEIRDRAKDVIISGGENISSIELENTLLAHPDIADAAVVSRPDERWGEVPVAFVTVKPGRSLDEQGVIAFCREQLAHFKAPKAVFFEPLPRTSTGKVQKFALRERMWQGYDKRVKG